MKDFVEYLTEKAVQAGQKHRDPKFGGFSDEEAVAIMFNFVKEKYGNQKITDAILRKEIEAAQGDTKHPLYVGNQAETRQKSFVGGQWTERSAKSYYERLADATEAIVDMSEDPKISKYFDAKSKFSMEVQGRKSHEKGVTGLYGRAPAVSKTDLALVNKETGEFGATFSAKQLGGAFLASSAPDDFGGIYSSAFHTMERKGKISPRTNQQRQEEVKKAKQYLRRGQKKAAQGIIDSWMGKHKELLDYASQEAATGKTKFQRKPGEPVSSIPTHSIYLGRPTKKSDTARYQRVIPAEKVRGQKPYVTLGKHPHAFARSQAKAAAQGKVSTAKRDPAVVRMETEPPPVKRQPRPAEDHPLMGSNMVPGSPHMPFHSDHELNPRRRSR